MENLTKVVRHKNTEVRLHASHAFRVQLNEYETDRYFLQNFHCMTMVIHAFCKIYEHEIVLQDWKSKQKQFQVHNFNKSRE